MDPGLYVAATGMLATQTQESVIANNVANINTPGFKGSDAVNHGFASALLENRLTGQAVGDTDSGPVEDTVTDLSQGPIDATGKPLDLALNGTGYFAVRTASGVAYTRDGQFTVGAGGVLATSQGYPVLGRNGQPITIGNANPANVAVSSSGGVTVSGRSAGTIAIAALSGAVEKGDLLFTGTPSAAPAGTSIRQGALEQSSVSADQAMTDMIAIQQTYVGDSQAIQAIGQTLATAAQIAIVS